MGKRFKDRASALMLGVRMETSSGRAYGRLRQSFSTTVLASAFDSFRSPSRDIIVISSARFPEPKYDWHDVSHSSTMAAIGALLMDAPIMMTERGP